VLRPRGCPRVASSWTMAARRSSMVRSDLMIVCCEEADPCTAARSGPSIYTAMPSQTKLSSTAIAFAMA